MITDSKIKPNTQFSFTVDKNFEKTRIDSFISNQFSAYSRNFFSKFFPQGLILCNERVVTKAKYVLSAGDIVVVQFPAEKKTTLPSQLDPSLQVKIIDQNEQFLIISKPAGLIVHAPSPQSTQPTLVDWLLHYESAISNIGTFDRPGIIHRLDKDTSGLIIIPKTNYAYNVFGDLFRSRNIEKTYLAIVKGHPDKIGTIDLPIGRDPYVKIKMRAFSQKEIEKFAGSTKIRDSYTAFQVLKYFDNYSLVEVRPKTGRTHQIRVHFAAIGHPLLGDCVYGQASSQISRHALHASGITFTFDGQDYNYSQQAPDDMIRLIL